MNRDKTKYSGLFIVFEGLDGTGKSTQIKKIKEYLVDKNYDVISLYQPTYGFYGKKLRDLFIKGHIIPIKDEILLSVNDRRESVENEIKPALEQQKIVLLDRYYWSNAAYQGILEENYSVILKKNNEFPDPDIIVFFDIDVQTANKRISDERKEKPNQFEAINNLEKSKIIFDSIIADKSFKGELIIIDANKDIDLVFKSILKELIPLIENWNKKRLIY